MVARDLAKLTYRLHDQRAKLAPSLELRRNHLTAAFHGQLRAEKQMIEARIARLQPGTRRVFLQHRLEQLNARAGMKPVGL
jgi:DNA-directed RNA polymerase specialized sigma24 family protein